MVEIQTNKGNIKVELDRAKAPKTVENFIQYVKDKHYDNTVFHRVIPAFMIQGGGLTQDLKGKGGNRAPIKNEATNGLKNMKYTIAMARTGIVDSATDQFFINVKDNDFLNHRSPDPRGFGYAVFGKVVEGQDVVHAIEGVKTSNQGPHQNVPVEPVIIKTVKLIKE